jgi:hypothetical protein
MSYGYVFSLEINYTIKFIFKADSINLASVEEVPILFVDGYREIVIYRLSLKKQPYPYFKVFSCFIFPY